MDMKKLLETVTKFAGEPEQKPGDQWRGTDSAPPGKKLVGDSILKDLSRGPSPKTQEQELAEQFDQFLQQLEEENLGVHEKRPSREGSRPRREYTKDDKPSTRYKTIKPDTDESRGHKQIATKLGNMDRARNVQIPTPQERQAQINKRKEQEPKKQVKEYGANNPPQTTPAQTPQQNQQQAQQAKNVAQGTQALKAAVGSTAPTDVLAKAIDSASKGTAIDATSAKALEPMMGIIKQAAQDPNLATQFKTIANQAKTSAAKNPQST